MSRFASFRSADGGVAERHSDGGRTLPATKPSGCGRRTRGNLVHVERGGDAAAHGGVAQQNAVAVEKEHGRGVGRFTTGEKPVS